MHQAQSLADFLIKAGSKYINLLTILKKSVVTTYLKKKQKIVAAGKSKCRGLDLCASTDFRGSHITWEKLLGKHSDKVYRSLPAKISEGNKKRMGVVYFNSCLLFLSINYVRKIIE